MDIEEKTEIILKPPTEEVITVNQLRSILETEAHPTHYIGFEISGLMHLGTLVISGFKINDFIKAGIRCKVFLADWHSYINNKFGGDWDKIKLASKYYEEVFKFFCPGVEVTHGSELYRGNDDYWKNLVKFSKHITLARNTRCLTIMGRSKKDRLDFAQYLYPPMQSIDIKAMNIRIVHAGMDQRKVHVLVREVFPKLKWKAPVAIHNSLLPGLSKPHRSGLDDDSKIDMLFSSKMSKSKPSTCIFIHDDFYEIKRKLQKAWCPEGVTDYNPVLEMAKQIVFHDFKSLEIERPAKYGGLITFENFSKVEKAYRDRKLHPTDLKLGVAKALDKILDPIRSYFKDKPELLEVFKSV
ncbi:MAG: tyrosine--tRNA ligase [Candidatus Methylarchaceae archaeon HK02M2]|nr:tyrosine--tRNA ligase [Candidatus Methylarchaceae archaeon HK02M2]